MDRQAAFKIIGLADISDFKRIGVSENVDVRNVGGHGRIQNGDPRRLGAVD
jgi:hypothetical protein